MKATAWIPEAGRLPGRLGEVDLPVIALDGQGIELPHVSVRCAGSSDLAQEADLRFDHACGGGPLAPVAEIHQARAFGLVNAAYHLQRGMERIALLLGRPLPRLEVLIGAHTDQVAAWGGGHYRLPAREYSELPERGSVFPTGEIHLGWGKRYIPFDDGRYFHAPAHNPAILYHELGHHLCRHTADFRLNNRRPVHRQGNRKIPLDEGTCDYLTAIFTETPDIFGWHRWDVPRTSQARRHVDADWTMAHYVGSSRNDPHLDGTVWASALWATRSALADSGVGPQEFDRVVIRALDRIGTGDADVEWDEALRRRRHFARALQALLETDAELGAGCAEIIEATFARRGVLLGYSNRELRDRARDAALKISA